MPYDPTENARHLAPVADVAHEELLSQQEASLQAAVDAYNAQLSMFASRGWQGIQSWLDQSVRDANAELQKRRSGQTIGDIEYIRGQVQAFETLAHLSEVVRLRRDYTADMLKQRQHAGA